ncbi:XAC0095 family protein [Pseudoxanthomonas sp. UC19_8]|uniref:XAC0095 family protein n=1 Tax=Pseudoxanthomonas sp. UC19_8 TaxID=3350175 RepID=UPI0036D2EEE8
MYGFEPPDFPSATRGRALHGDKEATMNERAFGEHDGMGYLLPEDSQLRLRQLRDHLGFLTRLAWPQSADGSPPRPPEVPIGEWGYCPGPGLRATHAGSCGVEGAGPLRAHARRGDGCHASTRCARARW